MRRQVSYALASAGSVVRGVILSLHKMPPGLLDKALLYVTGKGGVGKTTVSAALGLAAAAAGRRTIVCEVAAQERVSRAFQREGGRARGRGRARREPVGDHHRPEPRA